MPTTRFPAGLAAILLVCATTVFTGQAQAPRLVRSQSGPSGTLKGSDFVLDEIRNRFVFPQDRTVTIYFEWDYVPGDHVLTATWRQPDGRVAAISPDVKMSTTARELRCYWTFTVAQGNPSGTWTVDIRINGQPGGSHAFELAGTDPVSTRLTLDQVSKAYGDSVVRVHKLDATGRRSDTSSGFVIAANTVATSFQSIDSATGLEIEFTDGKKTAIGGVVALSRHNDWAVVSVDTGNRSPIPASTGPIPIGSQLAAFSFDTGARVLIPLSVGGVGAPAGYSPRIRFAPDVPSEAMGGPLINEGGKVVGILGGSFTPGARMSERVATTTPWLWRLRPVSTAATAVGSLPTSLSAAPRPFAEIAAKGMLTPPVEPLTELVGAGTVATIPKDVVTRFMQDQVEFSLRDAKAITVYSFWQKNNGTSRGELSATLSTVDNTVRGTIAPKRISVGDRESRVTFAWPIANLPPGYLRIDLLWNGKPVWRTYIRIVD